MPHITDMKVNKGDALTHERWNALVDFVAMLAKGPALVAPLVYQKEAIGLGQDFQIWNAKTTAIIPARTTVTQWGSGAASFYTTDAAGVESLMGGFPSFTAWNYFGAAIASGIRIQVCWTYDKWVILGGDCSGVA
jgi:hypothetical protein